MTGRHQSPKRKLRAGYRVLSQNRTCYVLSVIFLSIGRRRMLGTSYFSASSVVSRDFCALCVYLKFGHHPHSPGYFCAKFCFFSDSIAELARGEKLHRQSLNHSTQSLSHFIWCTTNRSFRFGIYQYINFTVHQALMCLRTSALKTFLTKNL